MNKELSLHETQQILAQWLVQVGLFNVQTLEQVIGKLSEEVKEAEIEALSEPMDREKLALELADIVWIVFNLATVVGIDVNVMMLAAMEKNFNRYNPYKAQELQEKGMGVFDSLKQLKSEYRQK